MHHRKTVLVLCVATWVMLFLTAPAQADDPFTKLGRGLINIATGWMEIPIRTSHGMNEEEGFFQPLTGMLFGFGRAAERTLYGVWDIASFPFPPYSRPLLDPDILTRDKNHPLIR